MGKAETLSVDALPFPAINCIARMARRPAIDRASPPAGALGYMRGHAQRPLLAHQFMCVEAFIRP
jgi:hypothetical protein